MLHAIQIELFISLYKSVVKIRSTIKSSVTARNDGTINIAGVDIDEAGRRLLLSFSQLVYSVSEV